MGIALAIAQDQATLRIHSPLGAEDSRFTDYVAALVRSPITSGDRFDVLINGDQIFPALLHAINAATERISLETYVYGEGDIPNQFTQALADAARRGVTVQLVLDAIGAKDISDDNIARLRSAGCQLGSFNPIRWYSLEELNYRTHRKILVVDGAVAFTGGVGIADHWRGDAQDREHWRDTMVKITGPMVSYVEAAFYENWIESRPEVRPALTSTPAAAEPGARSLVVWSSPTGGSSDLKRLYLLSLAGARRTVAITSPYFLVDESSRWALEQARRSLEYVRQRELRQPLAGAQRRAERRRHRPRLGRSVSSIVRGRSPPIAPDHGTGLE